jgi:dedicator of cytokinesis protein 3
VCTYPFQPSSPADLPLEIGDELYIIEQGGKDSSWYRGYLVAPPSLLAGLTSVKGQTLEARVFSGIFPRSCVEVREVLGDDRTRGRQDDTLADGHDDSLKPGLTELHLNGILTPSGSASPSPSPAGVGAGRTSKMDGIGEPPAIPVTKSIKNDTLRNRVSRQTMRSEASQHVLPLSPMSITFRDPTSPKPPAPVPMLKIGDETPTSAQEPLVDEIASCLREWHSTKLHELLLSRRYGALDKMSNLVQRLDTSRRQLLHKVLTDQELRLLREKTVWDLVNGNKMLCGEVIVRNPVEKGRILTGEDSAIEVTKLQSMMSLLDKRPVTPPDEHITHHLLINIPHALGELSSPKTIAVHLCRKKPGEPLLPVSEVHAINISASSGSAPEGSMRTLFVDLGASDMGEGAGAGSNLYLAFKVIVNETLRSPVVHSLAASQPRESTSSNSGAGFNPAQPGSVRGGRRSLMWGSARGRKNSESDFQTIQERQSTSERLPTADGRSNISRGTANGRTGTANGPSPPSRENKTVKRTVAAGIIRVDQILKQDLEAEQDVHLWTSSTMPSEDQTDQDGSWDKLLNELLSSPSGDYKKYNFPKPLRVFLKAFADPDAEALIRRTPTLLQNISQTRRIGFSGAPSKPRSDIYLTLTEAMLPRHAFLAHPKSGTVPLGTQQGLANLQLTLEVRRSTGQRIENCIFPSCNSQGHTAWRTTAAERGEPWNLTIRLAISPDDVPGSHIVMSIADLPGFPFALCWMPLWKDGAFIQDGDHSLTLYQYDEYTSSIISGRGAYLALPWGSKKKEEPVMGPMAALHLRTYLCSTKYSQNPELLGLLKWQHQPPGTLPALLSSFLFVPEIEVVKLLSEVLDALFEILVDAAGSEEYENLVFNDLVFVLGIVHDRRFKLAPLVDQYVDTRFKYPAATSCLVRSLKRLLSNPTDVDSSRKLRATFKVCGHIFKFIGVGRSQQELRKQQTVGLKSRTAFLKEVQGIFQALHELMKNPAPILIGTKTLVVQNFHTWVPELMTIMTPEETMNTVVAFVDSCSNAQGKLVLYKLVMLQHLSQLDALNLPETKLKLRENTIRWLAPYWGRTDIVTEQWKDQVRLCCSVVASQVDDLGEESSDHIPKLVDSYRAIQAAPRQPKKNLSLLFPTSYPFQTRPLTAQATDFDEALIEIAAVLAAITSLPTTPHYDMPESELAEFLFSALQVYLSLLDGEAYPHSWLSVHIFHHKSTMRSLEKLSSILIDSFLPHSDEADQFNTELWRAFFDTLLKLVGSDALALETFPEQKRRAVWKIAGDVRELGADLLRRSWDAIGWETSPEDKLQYGLEKLGGYQVQYVPGLVGPIVELCLSVHEGLRSVAIQVLQTMIISEWSLSQDLGLIQAEIIDCLDHLFKHKTQTESVLQKLFIGELVDLFEHLAQEPDDALFHAVKNLVATIDELLDLLVAVHSTEGSGEAFHIMDTLHLMEFLKDMQKEDIFIRYVHQLARLQSEARNYTEAGLALRLHADLYEWDPAHTVDALREPEFPEQTAFERKEQLYFQMIKYYEDGRSWDNALGSYMELADQYEHNVFDFSKLARAQRAMATIYESISRGQRENPRYFRVAYKGFGFPASLRDKQFICQGLPADRMTNFTDRLQQQHPSAQILTSGSTDEDVEGQYIHVYPVSPQRDLQHPIYQRSKVSQAVRDYYLLSRPNAFTSSSRRKTSEGGLEEHQTQVVEKTVYTTAEAFPTILRRSEIIAVGNITLTPLQIAIERTTRKTAELIAVEKKVVDGEDNAITSLTESLMLAVDPDSASSVSHYRALIQPEEEEHDSDEDGEEIEGKPLEPLENALKIALMDYALVVRRCLTHFQRPAHQATRADMQQRMFLNLLNEMVPTNISSQASKSPSPPR